MLYEVGKLLQEGKTKYEEGCRFDFLPDGPVFMIFYKSPVEKEIWDITKGLMSVGMYITDDVLLMLFKFGNQNWIDSPYNINLSKPFEFNEVEDGMGFGLNIFLVDASTGILKGMRLVGWSTKFSKLFKDTVLKQKESSFDKTDYGKNINNIYANYKTSELVKRANIIEKI